MILHLSYAYILPDTIQMNSVSFYAFDFLLQKKVKFLRLGSLSRIHPAVQEFVPSHLCKGKTTLKDLEQLYLNIPIVATTCLGIKHPLFARFLYMY